MVEFEYKTVDDGTLCVSGYMGNEAVVEVPAEADGLPVTVIGDGLFSGHAELTELKLPDGITDLGEFILDGCVNLRQPGAVASASACQAPSCSGTGKRRTALTHWSPSART